MLGSTDRPHLKLKAKETEDLLAFVIELLEAGLSWPYLSRECSFGDVHYVSYFLISIPPPGNPQAFPQSKNTKILNPVR